MGLFSPPPRGLKQFTAAVCLNEELLKDLFLYCILFFFRIVLNFNFLKLDTFHTHPNLSMSQHISNTCKAAYIQIRHISSIRHLLTTQATQTLACSLVLSRLDYCNSLLSGCPQYLLDKLQKVQNAATRLVCKAKKSDHIHPVLETLHWLLLY